jgi:hypothetical protein
MNSLVRYSVLSETGLTYPCKLPHPTVRFKYEYDQVVDSEIEDEFKDKIVDYLQRIQAPLVIKESFLTFFEARSEANIRLSDLFYAQLTRDNWKERTLHGTITHSSKEVIDLVQETNEKRVKEFEHYSFREGKIARKAFHKARRLLRRWIAGLDVKVEDDELMSEIAVMLKIYN